MPDGNLNPFCLVACEVFRPELDWLSSMLPAKPAIMYLEQGLHERPDELRNRLQASIDELENRGAERIILGYGLCGRGLAGICSRRARLAMPRAHDCIPLLLDCDQREAAEASLDGGTFWMSPGWLRYAQIPFMRQRQARRDEYARLYGEDNADFLMEQENQWLANYSSACLICRKNFPDLARFRQDAHIVANDRNLRFREVRAESSWLLEMLDGGMGDRFLELPPGYAPDMDSEGNIVAVKA